MNRAALAAGDDHRLRLEAFLPYRLSVLTNHVSRTLSRLYAERFDLTVPQWRVLAVLGEWDGPCADDVCRVTGMDKVTVSRAVRALGGQGRLARRRDPHDGRRVRIELTDAGREVYRRVVPLALAFEQRLLGVLDAGERRQLDRLLNRLTTLARDLDDDGGSAAEP
ncbi:MAG: MarR family winged helix-turn-helix transcriptional regulator [Gammaproteobacteria bacterium]|nr:MarR family winged helix-turn-helix transcriptional regulator [Gammaproteobacteria bacterium]